MCDSGDDPSSNPIELFQPAARRKYVTGEHRSFVLRPSNFGQLWPRSVGRRGSATNP